MYLRFFAGDQAIVVAEPNRPDPRVFGAEIDVAGRPQPQRIGHTEADASIRAGGAVETIGPTAARELQNVERKLRLEEERAQATRVAKVGSL